MSLIQLTASTTNTNTQTIEVNTNITNNTETNVNTNTKNNTNIESQTEEGNSREVLTGKTSSDVISENTTKNSSTYNPLPTMSIEETILANTSEPKSTVAEPI